MDIRKHFNRNIKENRISYRQNMLRYIFLLICLLQFRHTMLSVMGAVTPKPIIINGTYINPELGKYHSKLRTLARSCRDIKEKYNASQDGIYFLTTGSGSVYQTFCDMTTSGGGWTLVASVHENNIHGKCSFGDRWSSQQGNDFTQPAGDGTWANTATFGTAEGSTSDDYKNPGYYDITAQDVSVWHVPNDEELKNWTAAAILRYHTESQFLSEHGGNLYNLFKKYPVKYAAGLCKDMGPSSPVMYDTGDKNSTADLYGPSVRSEFIPGFVTFRVFNADQSAMAMCSGVKPTGCNSQHYCIGGGGFFAEQSHCGDFTGFEWTDEGAKRQTSACKAMTESAVLLFYR